MLQFVPGADGMLGSQGVEWLVSRFWLARLVFSLDPFKTTYRGASSKKDNPKMGSNSFSARVIGQFEVRDIAKATMKASMRESQLG